MSGEGEGGFSVSLRRYESSAMTQCSFLQIVYVQNMHEMFIFTIEIFIFIHLVMDENAGIDSG